MTYKYIHVVKDAAEQWTRQMTATECLEVFTAVNQHCNMQRTKVIGTSFYLLFYQGPALIETSSELIHTGHMLKVSASGWTQDRVLYLFDHQLIYCKKVWCETTHFLDYYYI